MSAGRPRPSEDTATPYRHGGSRREDSRRSGTATAYHSARSFDAALAYRDARVAAWLSFGLALGAGFVAWGHGLWMLVTVVPAIGLAVSLRQARRATHWLARPGD